MNYVKRLLTALGTAAEQDSIWILPEWRTEASQSEKMWLSRLNCNLNLFMTLQVLTECE